MTSCFGPQAVPMMTQASNVGEGWHPLLKELEQVLNTIDPDYTLQQVKEKFGGLRYYTQNSAGVTEEARQAFNITIRYAEDRSTRICEVCGEEAETKSYRGWLKTFCEEHSKERQDRMKKELEELHREHGGEG